MSFKAVAKGMAQKQGISTERASAELASATRRNMRKNNLSTKHGIPKGVFNKPAFKTKNVNMPGMSVHPIVNCSQSGRKGTMDMRSAGCAS